MADFKMAAIKITELTINHIFKGQEICWNYIVMVKKSVKPIFDMDYM